MTMCLVAATLLNSTGRQEATAVAEPDAEPVVAVEVRAVVRKIRVGPGRGTRRGGGKVPERRSSHRALRPTTRIGEYLSTQGALPSGSGSRRSRRVHHLDLVYIYTHFHTHRRKVAQPF